MKKKEFEQLSQALIYLRQGGWKISRSKFYEDKHLLIEKERGPILKANIDRYAAAYLRKTDELDENPTVAEKSKEETRLTKERADKVALGNEITRGMYVLRSETEQQMANRAAFLKTSLEGFFYSMVPRLIEKADGNAQRTPEVMEFCLAELDELFDHYSKPHTFSVPNITWIPEDDRN